MSRKKLARPSTLVSRSAALLQWAFSDLFDRAVYVAARLVSVAMHAVPVDTNLQTAKILGSGLYAIDRRHRERALANLRRSFPEMTEPQRERLARRSMQQMIMLFVEVLFTTRLIRLDTFANCIEMVNFKPVLEMLVRRERGLILLTGHYGNWEILGYTLATLGFETTSIARPLDNPYVSRFLFDVRAKTGQKIIAKKGATPEITAALDQKSAVGFIADQNAGSKGVFVDFFGRKASTYKSIGLLAMQYEVPIVIGYARRINDRFHFEVGAQDIIHPSDWKSQDDPLRYITQRYTRAIEDIVRVDPGQYWWVHRRWKTRPKGEEAAAYD
jgi:Kdo2-lipid IVA lauroyltransferase/acyltransferase